MCKRNLIFVMLFSLLLTSGAQALTIEWISQNDGYSGGDAADQGFIDLLRAQGYTVNYEGEETDAARYWDALDAAKIAKLEAADLIIVGIDNYEASLDDYSVEWNAITTPMICMYARVIDSGGDWGWAGGNQVDVPAATLLQAVATGHPIFAGVALDGSNQAGILTSDTNTNSDTYTAGDNMTLIATRADTGTLWIAEWAAGATDGDRTVAGSRLFFAGGAENSPIGAYNFNAAGEKMFLNAVSYMLGGGTGSAFEPQPENGQENIAVDSLTLKWKAGLDPNENNPVGPNPAITDHYLMLSVAFPVGTTDPNWANPASILQTWTIDADSNPADGNVDPNVQQVIPAGLLPLNKDAKYFWKVDEYVNDITPPSTDPNVLFGNTWSFETESSSPFVDAGSSYVTWLGGPSVVLDGTVTFVQGEDFTEWSVYATPSTNPADPSVVIADDTAIDTTATFTATGIFALELYAKDTNGKDAFDRMEVEVYADSCEAARNNPNVPYTAPEYDFNDDCQENLADFALFAAKWLENFRAIANEPYDAGVISVPTITINAPLDSATVSGVVTIDATVYDDYVGTTDGDGIQTVWINVYEGTDTTSPARVWVAGNGNGDTAAPYTYDWDSVTGADPDGVYTIRIAAQSAYGYAAEEVPVTLDNTP